MNIAVDPGRPSLHIDQVDVLLVMHVLTLGDLRCTIEVASDGSSVSVASRRNFWTPLSARRKEQ